VSARTRWLWFIAHTLNRATKRAARGPHSRFSLVRHYGRKTGRTYETVILTAPVPDGFVAELTYGPDVAWYRNLVAAGRGQVVHHGETFDIDRIDSIPVERGLAAFGPPRSWVLRLLRRRHFLLLHVTGR
jgi:deazaflavin-dependent oxidoreductase (nitroreductase family)